MSFDNEVVVNGAMTRLVGSFSSPILVRIIAIRYYSQFLYLWYWAISCWFGGWARTRTVVLQKGCGRGLFVLFSILDRLGLLDVLMGSRRWSDYSG